MNAHLYGTDGNAGYLGDPGVKAHSVLNPAVAIAQAIRDRVLPGVA